MHSILNIFQRGTNKKAAVAVGRDTRVTPKLVPVTVNNESDSRLYAFIIGINAYPKLKPLAGAVADATAMQEFLTTDLRVPPNHITNLRDSQATREGIIQAFRRIRDDPRIHKGDPILIFYAGHGGLGTAPPEWKKKYGYDEIQVIFPYDYNLALPGSKELVNCIPDRTIGMLLNELAAAKGDNITVIFDSCHSASGSRGDCEDEAVPGRIAREAEVLVNIPANIDSDIFISTEAQDYSLDQATGESRRPELPLYTDQASHVHFAACGSEEKAWEEEGRGVFTAALLKCIRASGVDKISYQNLMVSLPMLPKQSPHCYGVHKSRILFNSRVPSRKITFIPVTRERDMWILQAGAASGVTLGSIWELHAKPTEDSKPLGQLQAHTPHVSSTALGPELGDIHPPTPAGLDRFSGDRLYARQIRSGTGQELRVYFSPEAKSLIFPPAKPGTRVSSATPTKSAYEVGYVVHPSPDSADLVVELRRPRGREPEVEYTLCDPQATKYGIAKLGQRARARLDEVEHVLFAAARWNWHLRRTSPSARSKSMVSMELVKLGVKYGDFMIPVDGPLENMNKTGVVDLKAREEDQYGIRLLSRAPVALYVRLFYFDMSDFSIVNMFAHSQAQGRADPELPMHGQFMIGDESDGGAPLSFGLDQGEELDVGFIKVFWSTDPLELSNMAQGSAFEAPEPGGDESRKVVVQEARTAKDWGTILVTLVQRA
ncbi:hypothetical protein FRC08_008264 [Ceratobasidium sp. 394]|nr:hypothetical protein FRC08_008264 [Ceratobasidium sp. 394]KAG9077073.1 hypothetical protein FS749_011077 [Ceratobasidium sp. UAMH 11750]